MNEGRIVVVLNSRSGRQHHEGHKEEIARAFARNGMEAEIRAVGDGARIAQTTREALESGAGTIVAAGGDGTICAVASVLTGTACALGILPLGTFNYFARSLGLPGTVEEAAGVIAADRHASLNVARFNDLIFLNNASIGAYPAILETREGIYQRWGRSRIAAYWSVIKTLATLRAPLALDITVDGCTDRLRTPLAFAVNNAFQLDQMGIAGRSCIAGGRMVLLVAPDDGRAGLMKHAVALALGSARQRTDYIMYCGREIDIAPRRGNRLVARDGERTRMDGPFRLRLHEAALDVLVPAGHGTGVR